MTEIPETVPVPIEQLEALRTWSETEWSRPPGAVGDLLAHLPEPEPSAPIDGYVQDAGGGVVTVLIDRDTETYPRNGERARIIFGEPVPEEDDFGPHDPIGKPQRCGGCGEPWPCPEAQRRIRSMLTDTEPQPTDGPDYHADHAAWERALRSELENIIDQAAQDYGHPQAVDTLGDASESIIELLRAKGVLK